MKYVTLVTLLACTGATSADTSIVDFRRENGEAMDRMMSAMLAPSTGDVDRDFVAMMTPHHRGGN